MTGVQTCALPILEIQIAKGSQFRQCKEIMGQSCREALGDFEICWFDWLSVVIVVIMISDVTSTQLTQIESERGFELNNGFKN